MRRRAESAHLVSSKIFPAYISRFNSTRARVAALGARLRGLKFNNAERHFGIMREGAREESNLLDMFTFNCKRKTRIIR